MKRAVVRGDVVTIEGYRGAKWRVRGVANDLAHLTKMQVSQRMDYRDVPVARLTVKEGALS